MFHEASSAPDAQPPKEPAHAIPTNAFFTFGFIAGVLASGTVGFLILLVRVFVGR